MSQSLKRFIASDAAAGAAEFAMVLPLLLLFIFGTIDVGRVMWTWNLAEKATQVGARHAVVTDMLAPGLYSYSFAKDPAAEDQIPQGSSVPETSFGGATCTSAGCLCNAGKTCPGLGTMDVADFQAIADRMHGILPDITADSIEIEYGYSGLGYSGDPNGPDVAPLVTVKLKRLQFQPITFIAFDRAITLPEFRASMTFEDGVGSVAN